MSKRTNRVPVLLAAAILVGWVGSTGCASSAAFEPTESARRLTSDVTAAYYEIDTRERNWGDVKIWSPGAYREEANGRNEVIHVQVRVRNDGPEAIRFDVEHTELEVTGKDGWIRVLRDPLEVEGDLEVQPGEIRRISLLYELPPGVAPRDVAGFELNWAVGLPEQRFTQSTPFIREEPPPSRVYLGGYYTPRWYRHPFYDPFWPYWY